MGTDGATSLRPLDEAPEDSELARVSITFLRRYVSEVVIPFHFCPWAKRSIDEERVRFAALDTLVPPASTEDSSAVTSLSDGICGLLTRCSPREELLLIALPRYCGTRLSMDGVLRTYRTRAKGQSAENAFALAVFHPNAPLDERTPETAIPYFRRAPTPMIQAIRKSSLDAVDKGNAGTAYVDPEDIVRLLSSPAPTSLRSQVAEANVAMLHRVGSAKVEGTLEALSNEARNALQALDPGIDRSLWTTSQKP